VSRDWLACLALPLILFASAAAADEPPEWAQCTAKLNSGVSDEGIVGACSSILDAAKEPPDRFAVAAYSRALAYARQNKIDERDADLQAALRFDPKFAKPYAYRAFETLTQGHNDEAIKQFDQAIKLDPGVSIVFYGRGLARDGKKDFASAVKDFDEAIRLDPKNAEAILWRGATYVSLNQIDRGIADYDEAIKVNPDYAQAYYKRGLAYTVQNKLLPAAADLDAAIRIDPKHANAIKARDDVLQELTKTLPRAQGDKEERLFAFYLARRANSVCGFGIDDEEKTALDREIDARVGKNGFTAERANELDLLAEAFVVVRSKADSTVCATRGAFAGNVREMFDAVADRPSHQ
jgi:tetratricopeptide (TPR) repeat protein